MQHLEDFYNKIENIILQIHKKINNTTTKFTNWYLLDK